MIASTEKMREVGGIRTHSDAARVVYSTLEDLVFAGTVKRDGSCLYFNGRMIAREYDYLDSTQRMRKAVTFGAWLSLAMAFRVSNIEVRKYLLSIVSDDKDGFG